MDTASISEPVRASAAHLVVHVGTEPANAVRSRDLARRMKHWTAMFRSENRSPLRLRIDNLRGEAVFSADDAGPCVDVTLPEGTYRITAQRAGLRRQYATTLRHGLAFDLYLRMASG